MNLLLHSNGKYSYQKELKREFNKEKEKASSISIIKKLKIRLNKELKDSDYYNF